MKMTLPPMATARCSGVGSSMSRSFMLFPPLGPGGVTTKFPLSQPWGRRQATSSESQANATGRGPNSEGIARPKGAGRSPLVPELPAPVETAQQNSRAAAGRALRARDTMC
jgi:hypothetical protein